MAMANQAPGAPQVPAPSHSGADPSALLVFPPTQVGIQGVEFVSAYAGTREADSDRRGHFTATQLLLDATGAFLGSVTVDEILGAIGVLETVLVEQGAAIEPGIGLAAAQAAALASLGITRPAAAVGA